MIDGEELITGVIHECGSLVPLHAAEDARISLESSAMDIDLSQDMPTTNAPPPERAPPPSASGFPIPITVEAPLTQSQASACAVARTRASDASHGEDVMTLRQRIAEMSQREATDTERDYSHIVADAFNRYKRPDDYNIAKIFPAHILQMPVFTNRHAVSTIQALIHDYGKDCLPSMSYVCEAMQTLLMKTRGIYTLKER